MLLSGQAIKQRRLINAAYEDGYRYASYDVHIGKIIDPRSSEQSRYALPPQGIVKVVSRETVNIPENVAGFAMVKTGLCNDGILAINIGIIDPLYSNCVSSFLINFGKNSYSLEEGQVFLRLTFFEYDQPLALAASSPKSVEEYISEKKLAVLQHFSAKFLDLDRAIKRALEAAFKRYMRSLFVWLPVVALLLTLFAFLLNFGNLLLVQRWLQPSDQTKAELLRDKLEEQGKVLTDRNRALEERLSKLESELTARRRRTGSLTSPGR